MSIQGELAVVCGESFMHYKKQPNTVRKNSIVAQSIPYIPLANELPKPGDEFFVLGYLTGLRALLARSDQKFIEQVAKKGLIFWLLSEAWQKKA